MSTTSLSTPAPANPVPQTDQTMNPNPTPNTRPGLQSRPSSVATMSKTIVLVTGGNTGIGYEIVKLLSRQPDCRVLLGCRDTRKGEDAVASMGAPTNVNPIQIDITDDRSIEQCVKAVLQLFGRLDVLVNNAGTAGLDLSRTGQTPTNREAWTHIMNVNVVSTGVFTEAMMPALQKSQQPKIIFVSSSTGSIGELQKGGVYYDYVPYCSSKTAVNMMAAMYARNFPDVKVNAYCPGYRATGLNGAELNDDTDPALGAVNAVRLVNEGSDGPTGTFTRSKEEVIPW